MLDRTTASRRSVIDPWVEEHGGLEERGKETKLDISLSCVSQPRVQRKKKKGRIQQTSNGIKTRVTSLAQEVPSAARWWTLEYAHGAYRTPVASFTEGKGTAEQ